MTKPEYEQLKQKLLEEMRKRIIEKIKKEFPKVKWLVTDKGTYTLDSFETDRRELAKAFNSLIETLAESELNLSIKEIAEELTKPKEG